jgi:membrane protease YdiL (CAAX protease family)
MSSVPPPRDDRSVSLVGGFLLTALAMLATFGLLYSLAVLRALAQKTLLSTAMTLMQRSLVTLTLIQLCGMAGTLFVGLRVFAPDSSLREALAIRPVRVRVLALCFAAGLCLQFPLAELGNLLHELFGQDTLAEQLAVKNLLEARNARDGLIVVACVAGLVPAIEELFTRGFLLFGFAQQNGPGTALFASSVMFGLMHVAGGPAPILYATAAGFLLGQLALWTRSVFPGIAMHAAVNAVPVLLPERIMAIHGFNVATPEPTHITPWLVWPAAALGVALLAWVRRIEYAHQP